ncbi:hypothetical protein [Dongia sedimenti]|uniref:SGNH/GDSL hydrolase family protein n=1 Tax=Dongia sedimenti TaxID=3064282 RepID=A0ABU0YR57_9PROT|nr:hypothetical protein [Rhodospirillaceae bacterium R-7]
MKWILKQTAWLLASLAVLYIVILGVSLLLVPMHHQEGGLETRQASKTLYMTEPKYFFLNRASLRTDADRLILLGASNTLGGFRLDELQPLVPNLQVNNLSISGANITEMRQAYDMIRAVQSPDGKKRSTYVIGVWYGLFVPDSLKWNTPDRHAGDTDLDIERFRYGFYRRGADGPVQILPIEDLEFGLLLIHPYLTFDKLVRDVTVGLRARLLKGKPALTDHERNQTVIPPEQQAKYIAFWEAQFGGATAVPKEQFEVLTALVDDILDDGGTVVVADLPLPTWLAGTALNQSYNALKTDWLKAMASRKGFSFVEMQSTFGDDEFVDEVHPKPRITKEWSHVLATSISNETAKAGVAPAVTP